jgi:anti-sigma28 factor (negative regulator of flagellin synthesis)
MRFSIIVLALSAMAFLPGAAFAQSKKGEPKEPASVQANGGVFKCLDKDGNVTYGNVGDVKGCKRIETDTVNTMPSARPAARPTASGAAPRADNPNQRVRDEDRRRILQEELANEEKRLAELKKEFNNGEPERKGDERNFQRYLDRTEKLKADVTRSEANIDSLRRELKN